MLGCHVSIMKSVESFPNPNSGRLQQTLEDAVMGNKETRTGRTSDGDGVASRALAADRPTDRLTAATKCDSPPSPPPLPLDGYCAFSLPISSPGFGVTQ